jgi:hypothetical protein
MHEVANRRAVAVAARTRSPTVLPSWSTDLPPPCPTEYLRDCDRAPMTATRSHSFGRACSPQGVLREVRSAPSRFGRAAASEPHEGGCRGPWGEGDVIRTRRIHPARTRSAPEGPCYTDHYPFCVVPQKRKQKMNKMNGKRRTGSVVTHLAKAAAGRLRSEDPPHRPIPRISLDGKAAVRRNLPKTQRPSPYPPANSSRANNAMSISRRVL